MGYRVATISRLLKIIGLFCRIKSLAQGSFAKETYNFKEPTNRSHPIARRGLLCLLWRIWSLLQNMVSFIGLFCKRDQSFYGAY